MSDDMRWLYEEVKEVKCVLEFVGWGGIGVWRSWFEGVNEYVGEGEEGYENEKD